MYNLLSFIIPCYNSEKFILSAVNSIYLQKNLSIPFEIVAVDDKSTDDTLGFLNYLRRKHKNFRFIKHSYCKGGAAARNTCVKYSRGNLIFCLDSDNILEPNSISKLLNYLIKTNSDVCAFSDVHFFENNLEYYKSWKMFQINDVCDIRCLVSSFRNSLSSGNYLFTRSCYDDVGGYPEDYAAQDTWAFGIKKLISGYDIKICPNSCYWHRCSYKSYWVRENLKGTNNVNIVRLYREIIDLFEDNTKDLLMNDCVYDNFFDWLENGNFKLR